MDISYVLQHVAAVLAKQLDQRLQECLGIGFSQYKILATLDTAPTMQQRHIAAALDQTEASISRQVKLLIQQGMLEVNVNPRNRRQHITSMSPKGARVLEEAQRIVRAHGEAAFTALSDKQRTQLGELLGVVERHIALVNLGEE